MNKLQEAGQKVRDRIWNLADSEGRLEYGTLDMIEETVREVCVEYARSKIPTDGENPYFANDIEYKHLLEVFRVIDNSIWQDLQTLNN